LAVTVFSQKQEKIFYNKDWKVCSQSKAAFYRLVNFDNQGNPIGKVYDYFITGELQSEIEGAVYIDKKDDSKSRFIGLSKGLYRNGNRNFETLHDHQGNVVSSKSWHENGNLWAEYSYKNGEIDGNYTQYYENGKLEVKATYKNGELDGNYAVYYEDGTLGIEATYKNGKPDGEYIVYHENGKLLAKFKFANGKLADKFYMECDEFGKCQNVFSEDFDSFDNENQWSVGYSDDVSISILPKKGILMKSKTGTGFKNTINLPLNLSEDFSIEAIIDFKSGNTKSGHGLMWGFKDWDNYSYFIITASGHCKIGEKAKGIDLPTKEWTNFGAINRNKQRNKLKMLRVDEKMYFTINGQFVHSSKFYGLNGNNLGFYMTSGKKEVLFENLTVRQDISNGEYSTSKATNSIYDWKGNGSGFFIDCRGYIATNYHVVKDASQIEVSFIRDGELQAFKADVIQSDRQNDLAVLKIRDSLFVPFNNIPYNFQTILSDVGTNIFALGYPMANIMGSEIKFTDGRISSKTGMQGDVTMYQISVPIQSGNSGGALFDYDGNLIGLTSAIMNREYFNSENVNYAIKASYLKNLVDVLPVSIQLPNDKTITGKTLTEKVRILSDYVVLIKVK